MRNTIFQGIHVRSNCLGLVYHLRKKKAVPDRQLARSQQSSLLLKPRSVLKQCYGIR